MATMITLSTPRTPLHLLNPPPPPRRIAVSFSTRPAARARRRMVAATPPDIAQKVSESIKEAEETCAGDPTGGECAAAWDEVEELSAAASHARERKKDADPLEQYCEDNPETDECRTYED